MIKHIGKHNSKKIVLLYRQVPGEEHMCLVTYSDSLPSAVHDDIMKTLESEVGQQSKELNEVLFRTLGTSGNNLLETLHRGGWIKKVPTNQVIITPNSSSSVRLDELNKILNEMEKGEDAVKRLSDLEQNRGMVMPGEARASKKKAEVKTTSGDVLGETVSSDGALTDAAIAADLRAQAERMDAQAKTLLAEAQRLQKEAEALIPTPVESDGKSKAKPKAKKTSKVQAN